jgi:hypothetical protein
MPTTDPATRLRQHLANPQLTKGPWLSMDNGDRLLHNQPAPVVHGCPPDGSGLTPCCRRTPLELPATDRITSNPGNVTCPGPPVTSPVPA